MKLQLAQATSGAHFGAKCLCTTSHSFIWREMFVHHVAFFHKLPLQRAPSLSRRRRCSDAACGPITAHCPSHRCNVSLPSSGVTLACENDRQRFVRYGQTNIVVQLLSMEVDLNTRCVSGCTPLHYAIRHGCFEVCKYLVRCILPAVLSCTLITVLIIIMSALEPLSKTLTVQEDLPNLSPWNLIAPT